MLVVQLMIYMGLWFVATIYGDVTYTHLLGHDCYSFFISLKEKSSFVHSLFSFYN